MGKKIQDTSQYDRGFRHGRSHGERQGYSRGVEVGKKRGMIIHTVQVEKKLETYKFLQRLRYAFFPDDFLKGL